MLRNRIDDSKISTTPAERAELIRLGELIDHDISDVMLVVRPATSPFLLTGVFLFGERQLLSGIKPLLKNYFAVFGFRDVHGFRTFLQFVRHFLGHIDADGLSSFSFGIGCHNDLSVFNVLFS